MAEEIHRRSNEQDFLFSKWAKSSKYRDLQLLLREKKSKDEILCRGQKFSI